MLDIVFIMLILSTPGRPDLDAATARGDTKSQNGLLVKVIDAACLAGVHNVLFAAEVVE